MFISAEARGLRAGKVVELKFSSDERPVMVYDSREGLFGGAAIKGGKVSRMTAQTRNIIARSFPREILSGEGVKPTKAARSPKIRSTRRNENAAPVQVLALQICFGGSSV